MGGTMRLGGLSLRSLPGEPGSPAYGTLEISERHRHRYEVDIAFEAYSPRRACGLRHLSGRNPSGDRRDPGSHLVRGCQFHPEFKSRPLKLTSVFGIS